MPIRREIAAAWLCAMALLLMSSARAAPMVLFSVDDVGAGLFQYNLIVDNSTGGEPLSGLLVLNGNSLFGLDDTSEIGAPQNVAENPAANWSFFAPLPAFSDILFYFSLDPAADIPTGGSLAGFFFRSTLDPLAVTSGGFAVEAIGAIFGNEIPLSNARFISEPPACFWLPWE